MSDESRQGNPRSALDGKVLSGAVQLGLIAATSAVLGGLAVAWWHRKTLDQLRDTGGAHPGESADQALHDE